VTDTQWPRFEVFEQERPGQPHRNAGAVHAPDAEMALQNARDVFVRRPECHSLWVVPAGAILSRTAEELAAGGTPAPEDRPAQAEAPAQTYLIFQKQTQRQGETFVVHAGQVSAPSPEAALAQALEQLGGTGVYVWWVVPEAAFTRSDPADAEPLFAPARDKPFRLPRHYHVQSQMREHLRATQGTPAAPAPPETEPTA
jgi:ring-1,2-phenylacetyl-CoA epoxidase subunit PaaB